MKSKNLSNLDWDQAIVNNNTEEIERYMSDYWVLISTNGVLPKSQFLQLIRSGALTIKNDVRGSKDENLWKHSSYRY